MDRIFIDPNKFVCDSLDVCDYRKEHEPNINALILVEWLNNIANTHNISLDSIEIVSSRDYIEACYYRKKTELE
jgi:hypothetical protein